MYYEYDFDREKRDRGRYLGTGLMSLGVLLVAIGTKSFLVGIGLSLVVIGSRFQLVSESDWIHSWVNKYYRTKS